MGKHSLEMGKKVQQSVRILWWRRNSLFLSWNPFCFERVQTSWQMGWCSRTRQALVGTLTAGSSGIAKSPPTVYERNFAVADNEGFDASGGRNPKPWADPNRPYSFFPNQPVIELVETLVTETQLLSRIAQFESPPPPRRTPLAYFGIPSLVFFKLVRVHFPFSLNFYTFFFAMCSCFSVVFSHYIRYEKSFF